MLLRERALIVEEAASKAREEALSYKNVVADLDKEKGLLKTDLDSLRESFQRMKVEHVNGEIARSTMEEAKKKALEDLEEERARSRSLSDDVDRLKRALLEKDGAIAQAGKAIEDLRVANTELARTNREVERANTTLVGENTALEESIHGMFLYYPVSFLRCVWCDLIYSCRFLQVSRMSCWLPRSRPAPSRPSSRGRLP